MSNRLRQTSDRLSAESIRNGRVRRKSIGIRWTSSGSVKYWLPGMKWNEFSIIHGKHFILNLLQPYFIPLEKLFTISFSLVYISYNIPLVLIYISFTTSFPHGNFIIISLFHSPWYLFCFIFHSSGPIFRQPLHSLTASSSSCSVSFSWYLFHIIFHLSRPIFQYSLHSLMASSSSCSVSFCLVIISSFSWVSFISLWHLFQKIPHSPRKIFHDHIIPSRQSYHLSLGLFHSSMAPASQNNSLTYGRYFTRTSFPHNNHIIFPLGWFIPYGTCFVK